MVLRGTLLYSKSVEKVKESLAWTPFGYMDDAHIDPENGCDRNPTIDDGRWRIKATVCEGGDMEAMGRRAFVQGYGVEMMVAARKLK